MENQMTKGTEIKNAKQQVEQEQTQTNVEMTLLSQDDGDVNREDAPDKGLKESTKEQLNMTNNPPVESQHTVSKPPSSESLEEDPHDEEESFSTQQLFKFSWQIARGMLIIAPGPMRFGSSGPKEFFSDTSPKLKELQIGLFLIVYDRYQLMTDCWKEEPKARPSFYQLIEKLEIIMQKDAPYLDVNKHNEAHPYYNVPPHLE
ncbi:unnamed protein product [Porites lobata]|uniref:Uncharacterized protein n=1 Tax=Porites lobata TaxID=104759 RepID=A0ABN8SH87_9CNID|nr:unnamed protein product [Porites lobata]